MGIPIWSPQKQQHQHEHELLKRRLPSRQLLLQAALINQHPRHRSRHQQQRHSTAAESNDGYTRTHPLSSPPEASSQETQLAADRQMEQRFSEKKELLDQLKITTSLLDQFLSMGDLSSQGSALPPFITNDLVAILSATSASLTTSNPSVSPPSSSSSPSTTTTSSNPTTSASSSNITTASSPSASSIHGNRPIDFRSLQSYNPRNNNDTRLTGLVDAMVRSPPHAARWADLESNIASIHQRVIDQLILLGAGLSHPTIPFPSSTSLPTPIEHS